jgi:predicted phage terminase large subunit-like protein
MSALSIDEKVEQAKVLAPYNLAAHAWLLYRDERERRILYAPVHQFIAAHLQQTGPDGYRGCVFVVPPGYGKSTVQQQYVTWRQGSTGGCKRIALISNTASQAEAFSRSAQAVFESEEFVNVYPDCRRDPGRRWTSREMYFTNTPSGANPGILALGMDGPILGKRLDEIIIDDPTTWRQARSTAVMREQREKLLNTINYRFPPGARAPFSGYTDTRMLVFMTRYGSGDLLNTFRDDLGLKVVHMPALGFWDRTVSCPECEAEAVGGRTPCAHDDRRYEVDLGTRPLWPERESQTALEDRREQDSLIFELVDQGNVKILAGDMFDADWWQHAAPPRKFDLVVMGVDTSGGQDRKKGDYTAIAVLGVKGDNVWILNVWRDRIPATRQEDRIKLMAETWKPEMVYIEQANEGGAVVDHLITETRIPIKGIRPTTDKSFRAIPLANLARSRRLWLPENEKWTRSFEAEAEAFPESDHDDQIDAVTVALNETENGGARGPRLRVLG